MEARFSDFTVGLVHFSMVLMFFGCASKSELETQKFPAGPDIKPQASLQTGDSPFESVEMSNDIILEGASKAASGAVLGTSNDLNQLFLVRVSTLNIRSYPGTHSPKVASLTRGEGVRIRKIEQDWGQIDDSRWVYLPHLKLATP